MFLRRPRSTSAQVPTRLLLSQKGHAGPSVIKIPPKSYYNLFVQTKSKTIEHKISTNACDLSSLRGDSHYSLILNFNNVFS